MPPDSELPLDFLPVRAIRLLPYFLSSQLLTNLVSAGKRPLSEVKHLVPGTGPGFRTQAAELPLV